MRDTKAFGLINLAPRNALLGVCAIAASCAPAPSRDDVAAATPVFSAERFFAGPTRGDGVLSVITQSAQPVVVHGTGRVSDGGLLVLDQTVDRAGARTTREWRIRQISPGRYGGSLTDAVGPVAGEVTGNSLHLHFAMKGGEEVEQRLYLSPDGRSAHNLMTVRKWGVEVATLDERIVKGR